MGTVLPDFPVGELIDSSCEFLASPGTVADTPVVLSLRSCDGSGHFNGEQLVYKQTLAVNVRARDDSFRCSTPCKLQITIAGTLTASGKEFIGDATLSGDIVDMPSFEASKSCSSDIAALLNKTLSAVEAYSWLTVGFAAW